MSLNRAVLVINASYEGVNVVAVRRAMTLLVKGAAVEEVSTPWGVKTARLVIPIPSVIRLVNYRKLPRHKRAVSRKGIMIRDGHRCQYCGVKQDNKVAPPVVLTLDHVLPRSRGGENTWENLVACCTPCNNRKGSRTPAEAGMSLARVPRQISIHAKNKLLGGLNNPDWEKYLFC